MFLYFPVISQGARDETIAALTTIVTVANLYFTFNAHNLPATLTQQKECFRGKDVNMYIPKHV